MMLIKSFIAKELIAFLEKEFIAYEPDLQEAFLNDVAHEIKALKDWVNKKISDNKKQP